MLFDDKRDTERLRSVVAIAAVTFLLLIVLVAVTEYVEPQPVSIIELRAQDGSPDRCASCHEDVLNAGAHSVRAHPVRAHPVRAHLQHNLADMGCSVCHGGTPRALLAEAAHRRNGEAHRDPALTSPGIEARCAQCHPVGIEGTENLHRGAELFLGLGCALCHGTRRGGEATFGPELRQYSRMSQSELADKILDPGASSPMPSFRHVLERDSAEMAVLMSYVESLALPVLQERTVGQNESMPTSIRCTSCHYQTNMRAAGPYRHRCVYLKSKALSCEQCHTDSMPPSSVPVGENECPRIGSARNTCGLCHGN